MISRLQARLDLQIMLASPPKVNSQQPASGKPKADTETEEDENFVRVSRIAPYDATWTRNLPAVADELEVTFDASLLPIDLRAVEGVRVEFWLFEHQDPKRCKRGDPGSFYGFSDELGRRRTERTISLTCRDWTSALLDAKVTPKDLKSINLEQVGSLESVVRRLVAFGGPFASTWTVRSLTGAGARAVYPALANALKKVKGKGKGQTPAKATQRRQFTLEALADGDETAVWDVICQLCARMGVVPEMTVTSTVPEILLIDALDLQTTDALEQGRRQTFSRNKRASRALTLGRTVATYDETLRMTRDADLPDQIVVGAWDHESGQQIEVAFPPDAKAKKGDKLRRVYQVAEGTADQAVLLRAAAAAWAATRQHQLEVEVETWSPWSDGGSPQDPDLLYLAAGAALAIEVSDNYAHNLAREEREAFEHLPEDVRDAFARAEAARKPQLTFQVGELTHTYSGGSSPDYSCRMKLNAWLGEQPEDKP